MIFILLSVVCLHLLSSAADDPCLKYESLINEKRSALYQPALTESNICDQDLDESVWYRFQVLPPQRIHDECVPELHCGTEQPIWINGDHPTADDPGPKTVKVCSPLDDDCCGSWESTILVKFCPSVEAGDGDGFYVYRLKRVPNCDMAYCAGNSVVCTGESVWNPVKKECTDVRPSIKTPVLEGPKTVQKFLDLEKKQDYDDFYFECVVHWTDPEEELKTGGEQFEVIFTFDGNEVEKVPPKITDNSNLRVKLTSKELIGQVGKTIGCQVRSYWLKLEKFRRQYLVSERTYFVGIRYSLDNTEESFTSPRIEIDESLPALTLYFQATVPISCPETKFDTSCKFAVTMADISEKDGLGILQCSINFAGLDADKDLPAQVIKAQTTPGIKNRASVLRFRAVSTNPDFFWHQFQLPDIPIIIKDKATSGMCESTGDPHITTFDKRHYHCYMEGDFLLAKSTERHFEVHVRHHKYGDATCNCAVAVREGNNVLGVNFCGGPASYPTPITYLRDNNVPGATITLSGHSYIITMPSGAYVRADFHRGGLNSLLQIYLHLNSEDYRKTSGLCGVWNGIPGDDTVPKGTTTNDGRDHPNTFSKSYRLRPEESFLNGQVRPIPCLNIKDLIPNICTCDERRAVTCAAPDPKTTTFVTQFTDNCNVVTVQENRRRRDVNDTIEEESRKEEMMIITADDIPQPTFDDNYGVDFRESWPTSSGITKAQAETECQAEMETSPVYQMCKDRMALNTKSIVDSCVADAQALDNLTVATTLIANEFLRICVHELEISVVSNGSSTPTPEETLLDNVVSMICPNQCNGNGNCRNGTCVCNTGFIGEDCSVNPSNPPQLASIRKGIKCDFRSSYCQEASIFASNFFYSEKFKCKITAVDHSKDITLGGSIMSNGEVVCKLPTVYQFTNEETKVQGPLAEIGPAPFYRWDISVTNDGSLYSNNLRLTVFDSKCQELRSDGTTTQKPDTCLIDGRCFRSGEASSRNRCQKCFPSKSINSWTRDMTETNCPSSATSLNISISIFAAVIFIYFLRING